VGFLGSPGWGVFGDVGEFCCATTGPPVSATIKAVPVRARNFPFIKLNLNTYKKRSTRPIKSNIGIKKIFPSRDVFF
jgi:hypothetical protein